MRFGIKTVPQHTTWEAMLAVWRAADDVELFESAWNFDHFYPIFSDSTGPCFEGWTMLGATGRRRTLRTAARWAHQWNSLPRSADTWRELREVLDGHCMTEGRDPSE